MHLSKRILSLFLVLLLLPVNGLAAISAGSGDSISSTAAAEKMRSTGETVFSCYPYTGLAVGLQLMQGYTVTQKSDTGKMSEALARIAQHFTLSYPNPDTYGHLGKVYILPKVLQEPKYATGVGGKGVSQVKLESWIYAKNTSVSNTTLADTLYAKAVSKFSNANPNPTLSADEFTACANTLTTSQAEQLAQYIFGQTSSNKVDVPIVIERFNDVYHSGTTDSKDSLKSARMICNYAAIMLSIAKLMHPDTWGNYVTNISNMVVNALSGEAYTPVVITTEMCMPFEYNGNNVFNTWRTVPEQLAIQTGAEESAIRTADAALPTAKAEILKPTTLNPTRAIIKAARKAGGLDTAGTLGGIRMLNLRVDGADSDRDYSCRSMTSVGAASLDDVKNPNTGYPNMPIPSEGLWGCGIFGIDDGLVPLPVVPPTATAEITPVGTVGVSVDPTYTTAQDLSYSENYTVTIDIDLTNSGYSVEAESDSGYTSQLGQGLGKTMRWLADMRAAGHSFADPSIELWLSHSTGDADLSINPDAASNLISTTRGYANDGVAADYTIGSSNTKVSPRALEGALANFNWKLIDLSANSAVLADYPWLTVKRNSANGSVLLVINNLEEAAEYFRTGDGLMQIKVDVTEQHTLASETVVNTHWYIVGAVVSMAGPKSLDDMASTAVTSTCLSANPKYAYASVSATPENKPFFYSAATRPFSEFKQGTVPITGGGSLEVFNSMSGTPTFTDTSTRTDFKGTEYAGAGRYYQYFASGGSEFVVQFDGEYVESASASRTYTASFSGVHCDLYHTQAHIPCPGHTDSKGKTTYCGHGHCPTHAPCTSNHTVSDNFTWTQEVSGFSYVKITNLKVWELSAARLDGTRELLDTDVVTASVISGSPTISYNIAENNNAGSGRLVYSLNTKDKDTTSVYKAASNNSCSSHTSNNQATLDAATAGVTCSAICVSDYIVLRTTNGDQSILYYEYPSENAAKINTGNCTAEAIRFSKVPYATIWTNNSQTSAGSNMPEDGITIGGYNGNYNTPSTKYTSTGHPSNIDFNNTTVYKNKGVMSGSWDAITQAPTTKVLRLLNDTLVIPDAKQNGKYTLGTSEVFYKLIVDQSSIPRTPNYPTGAQPKFGSEKGFTLTSAYSPNHTDINDVVVYNPVSNENAIVAALPAARDQRVATHVATPVTKTAVCPGDATCPYLVNECTCTEHIHTEDCYELISYEIKDPNPTVMYQPVVSYWYHTSGCSYAYQTHTTTSNTTCTSCGHNCGYLLSSGQPYAVTGTYGSWYHQAHYDRQSVTGYKTTLRGYEVAVSTDGYTYMFGSQCARSGNIGQYGGSFPLSNIYPTYSTTSAYTGHSAILWKFKSELSVVDNSYTMSKAILSCSDPHHVCSYNWKLYTYGLQHEDGTISSGCSDANTTPLIFPTQEVYTVAQCAAGKIVRHTNGSVHLTCTDGICSYCGASYVEVLSQAESADRTPDASEYTCYPYGDPRCWAACGDDAKHQKIVVEAVSNGTAYEMGDFVNLDYQFSVYFPNTGNFFGTGSKASSAVTLERGAGYTDNMDTTKWVKTKWVEFPFAVVHKNTTYLAYERIYLSVPETVFEFYCCLHNNEMANAEVKFGSVAINTQNGEALECGANQEHNIASIAYAGKAYAHHHNADKRTYVDVVGRIGNLALNDTGDFRFANLFKQATSGWLVKNVVKSVDVTAQNRVMIDAIDIRGVHVANTGVGGDTYNTRPERRTLAIPFPLTPAKNNITALQRQPLRVGYNSYIDLTTLGNYYGNTIYGEDMEATGQNLILVKPHYYRLDLNTGAIKPVDVYMDVNGNKVIVNDNDSNTVSYNGADANVSLNWVKESARRNYTGNEAANSKVIAESNSWVQLPTGSSWVYGNYNILNLTQRNRTFVGSEYTYKNTDAWVAHKDPSDKLSDALAVLQGSRWHFNIGLPSSAVFVYSGQKASQENIDACASGNAVVLCALEIYAQGEVWTLAYDGSNVNQPFIVTPNGKTYDPVIPYPSSLSPKGEEMPIVEVISINHSSRDDLNVAGTQ